jgi:hypothetical protein
MALLNHHHGSKPHATERHLGSRLFLKGNRSLHGRWFDTPLRKNGHLQRDTDKIERQQTFAQIFWQLSILDLKEPWF